MACFKPIHGYHRLGGGFCFTPAGSNSIPMSIPCGRCIGCRIDRKQEWALRLSHELKCHEVASFLTLTYDPEFLPTGGTLVKSHGQKFMKRLRKYLSDHDYPRQIRFFLCGEYGAKGDRPHYHIILFGWVPPDGKVHSRKQGAPSLHTSEILAQLWPYGFSSWGHVTPSACSYVANYVTKKITGMKSQDHYTRITADGEMIEIQPEYATMSTRPGIGRLHYEKFRSDFRNGDTAVLAGRKVKIPRYYDKLLQAESEAELEQIKTLRKEKARPYRANNTPERLAVREICASEKLKARKTAL